MKTLNYLVAGMIGAGSLAGLNGYGQDTIAKQKKNFPITAKYFFEPMPIPKKNEQEIQDSLKDFNEQKKQIYDDKYIESVMNDKIWMNYSDSCYNLRKKIRPLVELELLYTQLELLHIQTAYNSLLLGNENKNEKRNYLQKADSIKQIREPLQTELLNQTKRLIAREKELKEN